MRLNTKNAGAGHPQFRNGKEKSTAKAGPPAQECPDFEHHEVWGSQFIVVSASLGQPPADKVLANVESITRTGDKVVITNKDSMRIKLLGEIGKTISFTINESVKGKSGYVGPALQDLKGVGIGIGPFATHPDHWGPE